MVNYYGIGSYYLEEQEEHLNEFYNNNMICISSINPERLYYKGMFENIKKGDIVFLKSIKRRTPRKLIIRVVGRVTDEKIQENTFGYKRKVEWLTSLNKEGIIIHDLKADGGVQRNTRIFQEFNPNIIKEINNILKEYRKD